MASRRDAMIDEDPVTTENEAYGLHSIPSRVPTVSEIGIVKK